MENSTSVLSIHLDQVPARSVGWPLVYFFLFNLSPDLINFKRSCHLLFGPLFPSSQIFPSITPFLHNRPGLSLWQVPPISFFYFPHTFLSLSIIGPACHCGRPRLFTPPSLSLPSSPSPIPLFYRPGLSLWQVPPIYSPLLSQFLHFFHSPSPLSYRPGLSLWQVSPYSLYPTTKNQRKGDVFCHLRVKASQWRGPWQKHLRHTCGGRCLH